MKWNNRQLLEQFFETGCFSVVIIGRNLSSFGQFCPFILMLEFDIIKMISNFWK